MTCATRYAEAADFNTMGCDALDLTDPDVVTSIESLLEFAAGEISAALASGPVTVHSIAGYTSTWRT